MYDETYLAHHGVKGQKWGVRRYVDTNGNLTKAGKKRYSGKKGLGRYLYDTGARGRKSSNTKKSAVIGAVGAGIQAYRDISYFRSHHNPNTPREMGAIYAAYAFVAGRAAIHAGSEYILSNKLFEYRSVAELSVLGNSKNAPKYVQNARQYLRSQGINT